MSQSSTGANAVSQTTSSDVRVRFGSLVRLESASGHAIWAQVVWSTRKNGGSGTKSDRIRCHTDSDLGKQIFDAKIGGTVTVVGKKDKIPTIYIIRQIDDNSAPAAQRTSTTSFFPLPAPA